MSAATSTASRAIVSTYLFCPGNRPERFAKAYAIGAPGVVLDLEDAVGPQDKGAAREHALRWLAAPAPSAATQSALRINDLFSPEGLEDVYALAHGEALPADLTLVLPKAGSSRDLQWLRAQFARRYPAWRYMALIETLEGLRNVLEIAQQGRPDALGFGAADLSSELGVPNEWEPLLFARSQVVAAAAPGRVPVLDVPELDVRNLTRLREQCALARRLGFSGKLAIHPDQVAPIVEAFAPSTEEVDQARRIAEAFHAAAGGVCVVDGRMVDVPVYNHAQRVLARAGIA